MGLFQGISCPVAERIARRGFYIPSGVALSHDQAEKGSSRLTPFVGLTRKVELRKSARRGFYIPSGVVLNRNQAEIVATEVRMMLA